MAAPIIALYPGSFDPLTNGHLDIIERAAKIFDQVVVGIAANQSKHQFFAVEQRQNLITEACAHIPNISCQPIPKLMVEFAAAIGASIILRGVRSETDFSFEFPMAMMNREVSSGMETLFIATAAQHSYISSTLVREVARLGGDISAFVPVNVQAAILKHYNIK